MIYTGLNTKTHMQKQRLENFNYSICRFQKLQAYHVELNAILDGQHLANVHEK